LKVPHLAIARKPHKKSPYYLYSATIDRPGNNIILPGPYRYCDRSDSEALFLQEPYTLAIWLSS